jgi:hypothetical protein
MSARRVLLIGLMLSAFAPVGCSASPQGGPAAPMMKPAGGPMAAAPEAPPAGGEAKPAPAGGDVPADRKIIFTGTLEVEVPDFAAARTQLNALLRTHRAFLAKTEVTGDSGRRRSGLFVVRVPVEQFQPLADALAALGNPVRNATDSQDVTEEYVDVSARVKNLKAEEEVLNRLLKDAAGRLDEVFKIREQIRAVRGDIERAEARVQHLGKMAALSTITLTLRETETYVAASAPKPTAFGERAAGTFGASVDLLRQAGEAAALFAVAVAPWLPLFAVLAAIGWAVRRAMRRAAAA